MELIKERIIEYIRTSNSKVNRVLLLISFGKDYKRKEIEDAIQSFIDDGILKKDNLGYLNLTNKYWKSVNNFSGFVDRSLYLEFYHPENLIINCFKEQDIVTFVNMKGSLCVGRVIKVNKHVHKEYTTYNYDISSIYSSTVFKGVQIQQILKPFSKVMDVEVEIKKVKSTYKLKL